MLRDNMNDVEFLKKGVIKNKSNAPYTILLVGETGVGNSSVLGLIANTLISKDIDHYDFDILDHTDEQSGSDNQSQTNFVRIYELRSKNGIVVRILDTSDTCDIHEDEFLKKVIDSVTAVLALVNGTVPRVNVGTESALSTLSAIFSRTGFKNITFLLTNTSNPLYQNFSRDILPEVFKGVPQLLLNNPIAVQRKYLKLKDGPNTESQMTHYRGAVKASEQEALEMLVDLFYWLDGLDRPKTQNIVINIVDALAQQMMRLLRRVTGQGIRKAGGPLSISKDKPRQNLLQTVDCVFCWNVHGS